MWRSAGWPCHDNLEAELLAAGLLTRLLDGQGRDTLRLTDSGVALVVDTLQHNRARHDEHEALVARVAREMQRAGRVVWRGLSLRTRVGGESDVGPAKGARVLDAPSGGVEPAWVMAKPDVYSIRQTTVAAYLAPVAHEIKVRRADLLSDLRRPAKGEAYLWLSGECWYVLREGIARADEIPLVYGVMFAPERGPLEVARPAPQRSMSLPFMVWMALARATPEATQDDAQRWLCDVDALHQPEPPLDGPATA